ncbi:MAG TPA: hypothetical protein VLA97_04175 [Nocardioidaceae bacterium]|nr:hypothetical protein [Nocardioidaceae bacterium]
MVTEVLVDVVLAGWSRAVGRPLQRCRARRLAQQGKIRSVLFDPDGPGVLPSDRIDGAAEVWPGRIRLWDADVWVQGVELPPQAGPLEPFDEEGTFRPETRGDLLFRPRTCIYTLRTHKGRVKWAVLDFQADSALDMLGFPPDHA